MSLLPKVPKNSPTVIAAVDVPSRVWSPFWPVLLVFISSLAIQCVYLKNALQQRRQMQDSIAQADTQMVPRANELNKAVESLGRDLVELAPNSPEAMKIVNEFKIQLNAAPAAPATGK